MDRLKIFLRENWVLASCFALALIVAGWFALQFVLQAIYFHDPRNRDVALKGWMTPRYVVMTYDLPREVVAETLGLTDLSQRRWRLGRLAEEQGVTMEDLTARVRDAAAAYREASQ